ncbi:MAG TPA: NifB/NifX family molybdenum-iron cluster-binding protein [Armatimonadota bacterium]|nr:NifB/NifX family molybdenum-iron cluster-binding protein [Armatimonadota bacterium]
MKIAIANDGGYVSSHFGHCAEYELFSVENGRVVSKLSVPTPAHEPCVLPEYLARMGVDCVIAGGMGARAQQSFESHGIELVLGVQGTIGDVLQAYLAGTLAGGESACSHSGHGCGSNQERNDGCQSKS